ncbi:hypothetical protein [Terrabacter carboxydivorans]|uniref:Uncharacterized protein n=1 Tax=Terrabacter carboxydivorans TaxID=619730 RepID=A0ABN3M7B6_9MICO
MTAEVQEQYWIKAKLFLNRATDASTERTPEERQFWASLALELLGKSALWRVSPALIAEPTEDGVQILRAVGMIDGDAQFTAVRAATIFKRCGRAFRPFNPDEATKIANGRNEYLHGSGIGFSALPSSVWWPRFWAQVAILVTAHGVELADLVGPDRVVDVKSQLEQNAKNIEHRWISLEAAAKQRLTRYRSGLMNARQQAEWQVERDLTAGMEHYALADCPACGGLGTVEGDEIVDRTEPYWDLESPYTPDGMTVFGDIAPAHFSCPTCHLVLDGYELLEQAGVGDPFEVELEPEEFVEPDYGND